MMTLAEFQEILAAREDEHLEFKEAKHNFHFERLVKYCAALANEGGGKIILGVTDRPPRRVVGSQALLDLERAKAGIVERLRLRVEAVELQHPDGRVVVLEVPARPLGVPIAFEGTYWMRSGQDVVAMTNDRIKRIFDETVPDFSAEICPKATMDDLDRPAIQELRARWHRKSGNDALKNVSDEQLLSDAELVFNGQITYAALILLGTHRALGRHLAQAEVIFEYRSSEASGPAQQREEYRRGFLLFFDDLWNKINLRNDLQHFNEGFIVYDIKTFNEIVCREAILNAVSHRDYRHPGSVFIRQYSRRLEVVSPGGFPPGVTPQNILYQQVPRNRRIAETFARCGLVERAGQGADLMFSLSIRESKPQPDFKHTDEYQVSLTLHSEIQDPQFLRFLEKIGQERLSTFTAQDFLLLDLIRREQQIPADLKPRLTELLDQGVVERIGKGKFVLSRRFYSFIGQRGVYTRKRGLDRETNKSLLLKHIQDNKDEGSKLSELSEVLPALSRRQVQGLLQELLDEGRVSRIGHTSASCWYPADVSRSDS